MELKEKNSSRDRKKDLSDIPGINQPSYPPKFINGLYNPTNIGQEVLPSKRGLLALFTYSTLDSLNLWLLDVASASTLSILFLK